MISISSLRSQEKTTTISDAPTCELTLEACAKAAKEQSEAIESQKKVIENQEDVIENQEEQIETHKKEVERLHKKENVSTAVGVGTNLIWLLVLLL